VKSHRGALDLNFDENDAVQDYCNQLFLDEFYQKDVRYAKRKDFDAGAIKYTDFVR
jgi:hypothetical protein